MAGALLVCGAGSVLCGPARAAAPQRPAPAVVDRAAVAAGKQVYDARKCAGCHQIAGHGNARFPLDRVAVGRTTADLRRWLTDTAAMERAQPRMPAVRMSEWLDANRRLSDEDIERLVAYLSTLK